MKVPKEFVDWAVANEKRLSKEEQTHWKQYNREWPASDKKAWEGRHRDLLQGYQVALMICNGLALLTILDVDE